MQTWPSGDGGWSTPNYYRRFESYRLHHFMDRKKIETMRKLLKKQHERFLEDPKKAHKTALKQFAASRKQLGLDPMK